MSINNGAKENLFRKYEAILRCPLCQNSMKLADRKSLVCAERHCFDLAKQGYVNLLTHGIKTKYDKQLFAARKALAQSGFFAPLNEQIGEIITTYINNPHRTLRILDAGCGEGSHLANIQQKVKDTLKDQYDGASDETGADHLKVNDDRGQLRVDSGERIMDELAPAEAGVNIVGVGMDIAKEGIILAARDYDDIFWCVGDLAKCPFADESFAVILNILSPANYAEFTRVLADDGLIIKVIPEKDYLKELRTLFYEETEREDYSNASTLELFANQLELLKVVPVQYQVTLNQPLIEQLVRMTPLTWGAKQEQVAKALRLDNLKITVDLAIMIGRKTAIG